MKNIDYKLIQELVDENERLHEENYHLQVENEKLKKELKRKFPRKEVHK